MFITPEQIKNLRYQKNWFFTNSNISHARLLDFVKSGPTLRELAIAIQLCTDCAENIDQVYSVLSELRNPYTMEDFNFEEIVTDVPTYLYYLCQKTEEYHIFERGITHREGDPIVLYKEHPYKNPKEFGFSKVSGVKVWGDYLRNNGLGTIHSHKSDDNVFTVSINRIPNGYIFLI